MKVVVAGGGTTGHLSPGLAVADELRRRDAEVTFVGSSRGPEARIVPASGYPFHGVRVLGRGRTMLSFRNAAALGMLGVATLRCAWVLARFRPDAVLGTGGYASLPAVLAAKALRIPLALHEQNSVPGLANRVAFRFAARVGVSFSGTERQLGPAAVLVGNPVRSVLHNFDKSQLAARGREEFGLTPDRPTVLVFGGSQGARSLNQVIIEAYDLWRDSEVQVLHLCGPKNFEVVDERIASNKLAGDTLVHRVVGYTDSMEMAYACSDVALCRSGASTVAELAAVGLPAVLVPLPISLDDDQRKNAEAVVEVGGGKLVMDCDLEPKAVVEVLTNLLADPDGLRVMSESIGSLHRPHAAQDMADLVSEIAGR
ncbi:MAG: undecaprenyldiphospho-muramoylpentapeptide beta-N-acetylglucosaminyltransferase [Actinomycetota bacterium]